MHGHALYEQILDTIGPFTGGIVAKATLEHQTEAMGLAPGSVMPENLPELSARVTKGLAPFIGPDLAGRAGQLIRTLG